MVGYTPQVSCAVWLGSGDSTHPIVDANGDPEYGRDLPGQTWQRFMNTYLANKPNLPMATTQMITGGENTAPVPTHSATKSKTPTPTVTHTVVPTTSPARSPSPSPSVTVTSTPSATCTPTPKNPCLP
jgi:membrane peptidoglycan carboxypeptidase